jgi:hypothetical protein
MTKVNTWQVQYKINAFIAPSGILRGGGIYLYAIVRGLIYNVQTTPPIALST